MRTKSLMLLLSLSMALSQLARASDDWREIRVGENNLLYFTDSVYIRASWASVGDYTKPRTPKINVTQIRCMRESKTCIESVAHLEQLPNGEPQASPLLSVYTFTYEVRSWETKTLTAIRTNPHGEFVDEVLKIDMKQGLVQKIWKDSANSDGYFHPSEQTFEIRVKYPYETPFAR